ncbi:Uncharacterised protein [Vibrio cholerae]|nr:Uncharacterised protein [Vibrio cholerae]
MRDLNRHFQIIQILQNHDHLIGLHLSKILDGFFTDDAIKRGGDLGVLQFAFGLFNAVFGKVVAIGDFIQLGFRNGLGFLKNGFGAAVLLFGIF